MKRIFSHIVPACLSVILLMILLDALLICSKSWSFASGGSALIVVSSANVIVFLFITFFLVFFIRSVPTAVCTGASLSYLIVYKVFRIMHWPAEGELMIGGIFILATALTVILPLRKAKKDPE